MADFLSGHPIYSQEIKDLVLADVVLTLAFTFVLGGGSSALIHSPGTLLYILPIAFIAVSLSFVLHELMHKFVAQRFGAVAAFRTSLNGLLITVVTSFFGFLIGIPGATVIYTDRFTSREDGIVSLAGPLTNFLIFGIFFIVGFMLFPNFIASIPGGLGNVASGTGSYLQNMITFTLYISLLLAFFNMLPIFPLDGSKVLRWNKGIYIMTVAVIMLIFAYIMPIFFLPYLITMLVFAILVSFVLRAVVL
ncbi:MAG TPA: site-2 protease family protein [Candidatus Aquilonibacter sp.]|nr:site-2 protease family protein [Candidatus Aquilonibacter sp.]